MTLSPASPETRSAASGASLNAVGPSTTSEALSRHDIEVQIQLYRQAIRTLQSQLNTNFSSTSKLPPEVLAEIFIVFAADYTAKYEQLREGMVYYPASPYGQWKPILQVCSQWRAVALGSPRLWSDIVVTMHPEWMTEVVMRSRKAPLNVTANMRTGTTEGKKKSLEIILREMSRIRTLRIAAGSSSPESLLSLSNGPPSLLENLVIKAAGGTHLPRPTEFLHQAQRLQRLELQGYPFPWNPTAPLPVLKHLKVTRAHTQYLRPLVPTVLNALEQLPLLESLELDAFSSLPENMGAAEIPIASRVVALHHLRSIRLAGGTLDLANLLDHLNVPPGVVYTLDCSDDQGADRLADVLSAKIIDSGELLALHVQQGEPPYRCCIRGSLVDTFDMLAYGPDPIPSIFEIWFPTPLLRFHTRPHELITFCGGMPLSSVKKMAIDNVPLTATQWKEAFGHIEFIQHLLIGGNTAENFAQILGQSDKSYGEGDIQDAKRFTLHGLHTLQLWRVRLGSTQDLEDGVAGDMTESLAHCLKKRSKRGADVKELVLIQCINMDEPDVMLLENVVDIVSWDGDVIEDGTDSEEDFGPEEYDDYASGDYDDYFDPYWDHFLYY